MASLATIGKGNVGTECDHAQPGNGTLAAPKTYAVLEFALERSGQGDHDEIGGGIENYGKSAEKDELQENMAAFGGDELRNERKKKQSRFRIKELR